MTDLPKAVEADVFGAAEWAIDFLEPLVRTASGHERALLEWRLAANRARLAEEKGEPVPPVPQPPQDALTAPRAALVDAVARGHGALRGAAEEFVAAYEEEGGTLVDEILVAVSLHNVLKREQSRAAEMFEAAADELKRRVAEGEHGWMESAKSCVFRAIISWRAAGNEEKAGVAAREAERLGGPSLPG